MTNYDREQIKSMLGCLYSHCAKYPGLVESLEINDAKGATYTHKVKLVFTRLIQSNEHVPSRFIMPYTHMFEAIGIFIYFGRLENGISTYTMARFDYMPHEGHYLPPFTGLYNKIHMATEKWAFAVSNVLDSQRLATKQYDAIRQELLSKTQLVL